MKKQLTIFLFLISCFACNSSPKKRNEPQTPTTKKIILADSIELLEDAELDGDITGEYQTYYVLILNTHTNYDDLHRQLVQIHDSTSIPIDLMERSYNIDKDLIALPENSTDEMYAGEYFPRRFPASFLSLEYLSTYDQSADKKTIALVEGIYESKKEAQKHQKLILNHAPNSYIQEAKIYVGCMH